MNKIFALLAAAMLSIASMSVNAQTVDVSGLSAAQIQEIQNKAKEMKSTPEAVSAAVRGEVTAWAELGTGLGQAMVATAKEIGVAATEFAETPLGMIVSAIVVFKVIGGDVMLIVLGLLVPTIAVPLGAWMIRANKWKNMKYEYKPVLWGFWQRQFLVSRDMNSSDNGEMVFFGWITIASSILVTIVSFANVG